MGKHLSLYICCNLSIFLYSIFNIDQGGISGRHAFLKPESNKSGQRNLRVAGQAGQGGEHMGGWGRGGARRDGGQRGHRLSGLRLDMKLSGRQRMKVEHGNLGTRMSHAENEMLSH